jgi:hypothetical protein
MSWNTACTYMPNASWRRRDGKAQGEGNHPSLERRRSWSGKDEAQRRSAQAKRGRLRETPCAAPGQGPQQRSGIRFVRVARAPNLWGVAGCPARLESWKRVRLLLAGVGWSICCSEPPEAILVESSGCGVFPALGTGTALTRYAKPLGPLVGGRIKTWLWSERDPRTTVVCVRTAGHLVYEVL